MTTAPSKLAVRAVQRVSLATHWARGRQGSAYGVWARRGGVAGWPRWAGPHHQRRGGGAVPWWELLFDPHTAATTSSAAGPQGERRDVIWIMGTHGRRGRQPRSRQGNVPPMTADSVVD